MMRLLGARYRLPERLPEGRERSRPWLPDETFLVSGVWGANTLEGLMAAQRIRQPQPLPRARPKGLTDRDIDEFLEAVHELTR